MNLHQATIYKVALQRYDAGLSNFNFDVVCQTMNDLDTIHEQLVSSAQALINWIDQTMTNGCHGCDKILTLLKTQRDTVFKSSYKIEKLYDKYEAYVISTHQAAMQQRRLQRMEDLSR